MPVYEKKGRPGWHRVVVWAKGKSHEKLVEGTKTEARQVEARWRVELERSAPAASPRGTVPTFSAFCVETYKSHAKAHLRPRTWAVRQYQLATLIGHFGDVKLTALDAAVFDRFKAARLAAGVKPRTVNTEVGKALAVMSYAREIGVPCASPKVRRLPEIGRGRVTFWTAEQLASLFAALEVEAPDLLPIVTFIANVGCRKGEALACEQSWIDLRRGLITIQPNDDWQPKDNEPREIPISDALRPWLERALSEKGRYVFTTAKRRSGARTRWACWPRLAFDRARVAAGLRGGPHTLRHSFAAAFLAACPDMYLLSQILGHASLRTTETIYAHLLPTHMEKARNVVNVAPGVGPAATEAKLRWRAR